MKWRTRAIKKNLLATSTITTTVIAIARKVSTIAALVASHVRVPATTMTFRAWTSKCNTNSTRTNCSKIRDKRLITKTLFNGKLVVYMLILLDFKIAP